MAANNLVDTKQDLISALVQRELRETASLLACCTDYSNLAVKGSKKVSIPKLTSFAVGDRAFGAAGTETGPLVSSVDDINLDKNKYIQFGYDQADDQQNTINYLAEAIKRASSAHGRQINDDIITLIEAVAGLSVQGGVSATITADNILEMRQYLIQNFANMATAKFVIAADKEREMLNLPEFSRWEYRGVGPAPVVNGMIGSVYGVPVILNQQLKAGQAFMTAPEGLGFAFQRAPAVGQDTELDYGVNGQKVVVDCTYGLGGLQLGGGVDIDKVALGATLSPMVAKLID